MTNYPSVFTRSPDFRVHYHWLPQTERPKQQLLFQHMRTDFSYAEYDDKDGTQNYFMIHPEFEDENGGIIPENTPIPNEGNAGMYIAVDEMRLFHKQRIRKGVIGYIVSGNIQIAKVEVTQVISLNDL